jgi:hypothetical protein
MTGQPMARARSLTQFQEAFPDEASCAAHESASYWDIIDRANPRKGTPTLRRTPRRRKTAIGMRQDSSGRAQTDDQNHRSETRKSLDMAEPGTTG